MPQWRLRELAEPERWTPALLAEKTGLAYNTVHGIWTGKSKRADLETLGKLARVLKIRACDLIRDDDDDAEKEQ